MLLKEVAPAALAPVLGEFAAHLRLGLGFADDGAEDALLERYLGAAIAAVEARTGQALLARQFVLQAAGWDRRGHLVLPVGPVASVDVIRFVRSDGSVTLDPAQWAVGPGTSRQRLTGPGGGALPAVPSGALVELEFTAGHADAWAGVPGALRQAVLMLAAHYHENRHGDAGDGLPPAVAALLGAYRPARL
ncbi:MAG TPA: hypothetical protein VFJ13_08835 [Paracoccaceae bacterium]|nr:hypothetical protein [Paracoccaceae bacterium]